MVYGPFARYVKLWVAHAPGMPGTFSRPPWVTDPDMHYGTYMTHVPRSMPGSLTMGFRWSRWRKNFRGIPGACITYNLMYLVRGPWWRLHSKNNTADCLHVFYGHIIAAQQQLAWSFVWWCKPSENHGISYHLSTIAVVPAILPRSFCKVNPAALTIQTLSVVNEHNKLRYSLLMILCGGVLSLEALSIFAPRTSLLMAYVTYLPSVIASLDLPGKTNAWMAKPQLQCQHCWSSVWIHITICITTLLVERVARVRFVSMVNGSTKYLSQLKKLFQRWKCE